MTREKRIWTLLTGITKVIGVLLLLLVAGLLLDFLAGLPGVALGPSRWIGLALIGAGVYLEARGTHALWSYGQGTPNPVDPPNRLVDKGPYRFSRNPLYLARLAVLVGSGLLLGSPGVIVVAATLFLYLHQILVPREETRLRERYGEQFEDYEKRVPRWVFPKRSANDRDPISEAQAHGSEARK